MPNRKEWLVLLPVGGCTNIGDLAEPLGLAQLNLAEAKPELPRKLTEASTVRLVFFFHVKSCVDNVKLPSGYKILFHLLFLESNAKT